LYKAKQTKLPHAFRAMGGGMRARFKIKDIKINCNHKILGARTYIMPFTDPYTRGPAVKSRRESVKGKERRAGRETGARFQWCH